MVRIVVVRFAALDKAERVVVIPKHLDQVFLLSRSLRVSWWDFFGSVKECIHHWSFVLRWVKGFKIKILVRVRWFPARSPGCGHVLWKLLCPRTTACCLSRSTLWTECSGRWNWGARGTLARGLSWGKRSCRPRVYTTILEDELRWKLLLSLWNSISKFAIVALTGDPIALPTVCW